MRKLVFLLMALLLVLSMLAACAPPPTTAPPAGEGAAATSTETAAAATEGGGEAAAATTQWVGAGKPADQLKFGTVVKSSAFNWFIRMDEGVKQFAKDTGIDAFQQGPSKADAAMQIQVTEDVLAQNVDALLVVPYQVPPMEPVMQKARGQGRRRRHA